MSNWLAFVVKDRPSDLTTINVAIERYWYFAINEYKRQSIHLCFSTAYLDLRRNVDFMICILKPLRKMPPFPTAHTFCASPDGPRNSGFFSKDSDTNSKVFLHGFWNYYSIILLKNAWLPPIFFLVFNTTC